MEDTAELVFIAMPSISHIVAQVELAKNLIAQHPRISVPILIPKLPVPDKNLDAYLRSSPVDDPTDRITFVELPLPDESSSQTDDWSSKRPLVLFSLLARLYQPVVKRVLEMRRRVTVGILADMVFTQFFDLAEDLGVPSYVLFTSGANLLSMMLELETREVDAPSAFGYSPPESAPVAVPGFRNAVPLKVWPSIFLDKDISGQFLLHASRYRRAKGILVNTFSELESDLLASLSGIECIPPVYSVGPMLHLGRRIAGSDNPILCWLDSHPPASVVFLCFGSYGSFAKEQVDQICEGIEGSGHRFLWSLRRHSMGERLPRDYEDFHEVLPMGFQERTANLGKMIGWAPQAEVLAHPAVGAFVSHCGWNSLLESMWFGVPVVTWPMYAEQQLNAFLMVRELGIAVEMTMDYKYDVVGGKGNVVVTAAVVEGAIRRVMEEEEGAAVRKKVKEMSQLARKALDVGGSSNKSLHQFVQDVMKNVS